MDGKLLGEELGNSEGDPLGLLLGLQLGEAEGLDEGLALGSADGAGLGTNDGKALGNGEGSCDGCELGGVLGVGDGCKVGGTVSTWVGSALGLDVGGLCDGRKDGLSLGGSEGIALLKSSSDGWKDGCREEAFLDVFLLWFCLFFHFLVIFGDIGCLLLLRSLDLEDFEKSA